MTNMQARMRQLAFEVEWRIAQYYTMQNEVRAYEESCANGHNARIGAASVQTNRINDPTATGALRLLEPSAAICEMRDWLWVIDKARDEMHYFAPDLERILQVLLMPARNKHANGNRTPSNARYALMEELCIGQTTLYAKRNACIEWIKALALYKGLLDPQLRLHGGETEKANTFS